MLSALFSEVLYRPLFNALIALYEVLPGRDFGLAIVVLTILVRLVLTPILFRQLRTQRKLASLQTHLDEIRKRTTDKTEQSRRILELYKHHGVSPASGCLPTLIQLPILWAMYIALRRGLDPAALKALYSFVPHPGTVNPLAFGFLHLAQPAFQRTAVGTTIFWPAVVLALLTGVVSYWQVRLTPGMQGHSITEDRTAAEQVAHRMNRQMLLLMPLMTAYFALVFPTGLALYWFVTTLVAVVQQRYLLGKAPNIVVG